MAVTGEIVALDPETFTFSDPNLIPGIAVAITQDPEMWAAMVAYLGVPEGGLTREPAGFGMAFGMKFGV